MVLHNLRQPARQLVSTLVDQKGHWTFAISNFRTHDLSGYYDLAQVDPVEILIISGTQGVGYIKTMGLAQGQPLKTLVTKEKIPFFKIKGPNDAMPQSTASAQTEGSEESQGLLDVIWVTIRRFFGQS